MQAERHIFYYILLAFSVHILTAEKDPVYLVDAMNHVLSRPGWPALTYYGGFQIFVRWMEEAGKTLTVFDLIDDTNGPIVNYDNVKCKIRQTHQFLSCQHANNLKVCYDYNFGVIQLCKKIDNPHESLRCIGTVVDMIKKIDEMVVRMKSTLSCVHQLSPEALDQDVTEIMDEFKSYYANLNFDDESLDIGDRDEIIDSTAENMATAIESLAEFYNNYCGPISDEEEHGISEATEAVQKLEAQYPANEVVDDIKGLVSSIVDDILDNFDQLSLGFRYDPYSTMTLITYDL